LTPAADDEPMPEPNEFTTALDDALQQLGVTAAPDQLTRLDDHFYLLLEANRQFNLTRITDPVQAARLLYADAAALLAWAAERTAQSLSLLDVGPGGGFPAVPLAVLAPDWRITALEATRKKAVFLERSARRIGIANLDVIHDHGAHWQTDRRFDLITFKAVGALDLCLLQGRRYVAPGGHVAIYKTASLPPEETRAGTDAARQLSFTELPAFDYELGRGEDSARMALRIYAAST